MKIYIGSDHTGYELKEELKTYLADLGIGYEIIDKGAFTEASPLSPSSPYAASKAMADLLCHAYFRTYHLPVTIMCCSNNFGVYQYAHSSSH